MRQLINMAASSDETVRQKYVEWRDWIERLGGTDVGAIYERIPSY